MNESIRIGRIAGISVGINWSLIAIFLLIAFSLSAGRFPTAFPDQEAWAYAVAGLITAVLFFASVLAHEVSHALVAQRNGIEVDGIVLWLLGGVARLKGDAGSPGVAFRIGVGGLWLVLIGWFLVTAATAEESHAKMHGALGDTRVADVMSGNPITAPADMTVDRFLEQYVFEYRYSTFPITSRIGEVVGLVIVDDGRVLVMRGADLVGIVSPADVMRLLELRELVGPGTSQMSRG